MPYRLLKSIPALVLLLSCAAAAPLAAQETGRPAAAEAKLPSIIVTEAVTKPLTDRIIATGSIRPIDEIYVQPLVEGLSVKTINVDVADEVEANAVLATLNDDALLLQKSQYQANRAKAKASVAQYQAQVIEAQANLDDATKQRDRTQKLNQSGTSTVSQLEQANAQVDVARARLNAARQSVAVAEADVNVIEAQLADVELQLARTGVKAPVAGVISAKNAKVGAIASGNGDPLFTIIKDGAIELVADISESDIQKARVGQKALVTVAGGQREIEGRVRLVSPTVDQTTRLGLVHIEIDPDSGARAGMYGRAAIIVDETEALALPLSAVTTDRQGSFARKVEDGVVRQVKIDIGFQDGGFVQVLNGLEAGDVVVAKAGAFVRDGDHIAPVPEKAATAKGAEVSQ
ncbi:efflux RND transporter periplasmic adaptor subunit [Rhizobium wenxiniae]|uniref:efflux RND transporter periplasmic adaptor subunit n=1 Tax=Rhizobium wenxiniae TaxID=1737357 RepID=UPI001C6EE016|nr:efflux RND transporter periplasmic adaptor subunit [Rhizobium wenxiniae]MBW9086346.1 efflux RND transporter periplasmic adaptor subunit [Rhizobium wenxiniae]